ncbi:MAG: polysaccharide biosynthesis C-terminal domain-containing protein [Pirellulales bacterium]|nr:polysaccharide biosynthesis C-terminal domain-containing protein [Pirellulales bacterium]
MAAIPDTVACHPEEIAPEALPRVKSYCAEPPSAGTLIGRAAPPEAASGATQPPRAEQSIVHRLIGSMHQNLAGNPVLSMLASGASVAMALYVAQAGLGYLLNVCLGRWLDEVHFGRYGMAMSLSLILASVAGLGLPVLSLRFISQYVSTGKPALARGAARYAWRRTLLAGTVAALAAAAVVLAGSALGWMQGNPTLLLGIALTPFLALMQVQAEQLRALHRLVAAYLPLYVLRPAIVLAICLLLYLSFGGDKGRLTSVMVLAVSMGGSAVLLIGQNIVFRRLMPSAMRDAEPVYDRSHWRSVAWPLWIITAAVTFQGQIDVFLVGSLLGDETAGLYFAAARTAALAGFVLLGVNAIAAPMISALYHQGRMAELQRLVSCVAQLIFWPTTLTVIALVFFGDKVLGVFGQRYVAAQNLLIILAIAQAVNALAGSVGYLLQMTGHQKAVARVFLISVILNILLNALLIPYFGMYGAAIATTTSMVAWNVWLYVLVRSRLNVDPSVFGLLHAFPARQEA